MTPTRITVSLSDAALRQASHEGMDAFVGVVVDAIRRAAGGQLDATALEKLTPEQITLWGYTILHEELMDGGFVQLIYNGYGPFFFQNPFGKVMRQWGLPELAKIINKAHTIYNENREELTRERNDEDFMALFERFPKLDDLDDAFVEGEEAFTAAIAHYVDEHLEQFVQVEPSE